ncbi:homoprotocatechuate degradation operon regulator, HpaR [Staphylococcus microti]|uniref:Homoprotocatechuate degradation operon regulator, HpaR n=1 Tax=Staphylococcus microti TaxID=569857 RepID=A0A380I4Z0_9STAP|nr:MarR family transcriptional regulator [Staphylococcus microti]SUN02209.1 homoprotocatechuate degradation operon regulator, HpaR [Staphylococcus microti]
MQGSYLILKIHLLNDRIFNRRLSKNQDILYTAEQAKILSALWTNEILSAKELSNITGLATSSLSLMLKRLEDQGLIGSRTSLDDKRRKDYQVTPQGSQQQAVGEVVSRESFLSFTKALAIKKSNRSKTIWSGF